MNIGVETNLRGAGYEVLSPWADADPVPLRGTTPRLNDLAGKKIGLFSNAKRAANVTLIATERELLAKFPTVTTSWYTSSRINSAETLTDGKARFEAWVSGVDAVVLAVGD